MLELLLDPYLMQLEDYELLEGAGYDNRFVVRGKFQQADEANINGRKYSRDLWEGIIRDPRQIARMNERHMYGEADHPGDGVTQIKRVSHLVTGLSINPDGSVIGEAEILRTPNGNILRSLYEAKCRVGVSSRGKGRVDPVTKYVDESCYLYDTFDMVAQPSTRGAHAVPVVLPGGKPSRRSSLQLESVLKNAASFLKSAQKEVLDPALKIERICECLSHERDLALLQSEDDRLISVCEELLSGLSSVRSGLEESLSVYEVNPKSDGDTQMSNQTPHSILNESAQFQAIAEAAALNERYASLDESHEALMESYQELNSQYVATRSLLEAAARQAENLALRNSSLEEDLNSALQTVDALASHIEGLSEEDEYVDDSDYSEVNEGALMDIDEASAVLLETAVQMVANLTHVNEDLVHKVASSKALTEAALNRYGSLLFESEIDSILSQYPDEEIAEAHIRPQLERAETIQEAYEIFESVVNLMESARPRQHDFFNDHIEPLPHQQSYQLNESRMPAQPVQGEMAGMQQLTESILKVSGLR